MDRAEWLQVARQRLARHQCVWVWLAAPLGAGADGRNMAEQGLGLPSV